MKRSLLVPTPHLERVGSYWFAVPEALRAPWQFTQGLALPS